MIPHLPLKKILLAAMLAGAAATPALAQINIHIQVAPPPQHHEVVPVLAPDRAWAPGYWAWNGERHVWVGGRAIMKRDGYRWAPDHWEQRGNGYQRQPGYWVRDASYVVVKEKKMKKVKHHKHDKHDRDDDDRDDRHGKHHGKKHRD